MTTAGQPGIITRRRWSGGDRAFSFTTGTFAAGVAAVFVIMVYLLSREARPAWSAFGPEFLWNRGIFEDNGQTFNGAAPYLYGTLVTSLMALVFAIPVAIGTAIALVELLPALPDAAPKAFHRLGQRFPAGIRRGGARVVGIIPGFVRRGAARTGIWFLGIWAPVIGLFIELLAAVPSIIFGIWGVAVIVPFVRDLRPEGFGQSLLAAGLVLAVMILPIMTAITRDMVRAVPRSQRDAALALGATPWEVTWRIVLPNAKSGILAAAILGLGRAIGETMAVIMVIGLKPKIFLDIFEGGATMASAIASDFGEAQGLHRSSLILIGLLMLFVSLILSVLGRLVVRSFSKKVAS